MRYLIIPDPRGAWQEAGGQRHRCSALVDSAKVAGPREPITAASEAAAAAQAGLVRVPVSPAALALAKATRLRELGEQLRTDLLAVFASWTVGEQYDFDGARQALNADLGRGDLARAMAGVQTFRPAETTLAPHRTQVLALLTAAAPRLAAAAAAETPEQLEAI